MTSIGIMQGRLTPPVNGIQAFPRDHWRDEFLAAQTAGLDFIEWIFDDYGIDVNPVMTKAGTQEIRSLSAKTGVMVNSICADYFMTHPLLNSSGAEQSNNLDMLEFIFQQGKVLGISRIVLPFVDASAINSAEEENAFVNLVNDIIIPTIETMGIEFHLETSLPPLAVAEVLKKIPHNLFWINYDAGNSASLGYKPEEEFREYGSRIGSFHVKDRKQGGTTVPLGASDTDFPALATCLQKINYQRPFVLQVARGESGHEIEWARKNCDFTRTHLLLKT